MSLIYKGCLDRGSFLFPVGGWWSFLEQPTGFVLPFTMTSMNPIQNYFRKSRNAKLSNQEKFVVKLCDQKTMSLKETSYVSTFRKKLKPVYSISCFEIYWY